MRVALAIIKIKDSKFHFADTTKNEYLVYSPKIFNIEILKLTEDILVSEKKETKYTLKEFGKAYSKAFKKWSTEFKKETIYMR